MDLSSAVWRKSSRSGSNGGTCVELAALPGAVAVRDSKNPGGGHLAVSAQTFGVLLRDIKAGDFDL